MIDLYFPGEQNEHDEAPGLLKPVPHEVQLSLAPVEKVLTGQISAATRRTFALYPEATVVQNPAPEAE